MVAVCTRPVCSFVLVTTAPGSAPPDWSVTRPVICPTLVWAPVRTGMKTSPTANTTSRLNRSVSLMVFPSLRQRGKHVNGGNLTGGGHAESTLGMRAWRGGGCDGAAL